VWRCRKTSIFRAFRDSSATQPLGSCRLYAPVFGRHVNASARIDICRCRPRMGSRKARVVGCNSTFRAPFVKRPHLRPNALQDRPRPTQAKSASTSLVWPRQHSSLRCAAGIEKRVYPHLFRHQVHHFSDPAKESSAQNCNCSAVTRRRKVWRSIGIWLWQMFLLSTNRRCDYFRSVDAYWVLSQLIRGTRWTARPRRRSRWSNGLRPDSAGDGNP
jgi:hypothetical protein